MLILAIQTPQMRIFNPQIKKFWKEWNEDGNCEESHINWIKLVGNMLLATRKISPSSSSIGYESDYETEEVESEEKILKKIYDELKRNYPYLLEIIEVNLFFY